VTTDHIERFPGKSRGPSLGGTSTGLSPGQRPTHRLIQGGSASPAGLQLAMTVGIGGAT